MQKLLRELLVQDTIAGMTLEFEEKEMIAKLQKYDGAYVVMEVMQCDYSFGSMYAFMEQLKKKYHLREYQCKYASLEEVFNQHATQGKYKKLKRRLTRRQSTINPRSFV